MNRFSSIDYIKQSANQHLFENVRDEINELFEEYVLGNTDAYLNKKIVKSIIRDVRNSKYGCNNSVLKISEKELIATNLRCFSFYKRAGQIITAYGLLKTGEYSARKVSRICEMSINTVTKLLKYDSSLKCVCGISLVKHRGWCRVRFLKSEKRKEFIKNWGK